MSSDTMKKAAAAQAAALALLAVGAAVWLHSSGRHDAAR